MRTIILIALLIARFGYIPLASANITNNSKELKLDITIENAKPTDTLYLDVWTDNLFILLNYKPQKYMSLQQEHGHFIFKIPVCKSNGYFTLRKSRLFKNINLNSPLIVLHQQFWESGDNLQIVIKDLKETPLGARGNYSFNGTGALKYNLANYIDNFTPKKIYLDISTWPKNWDGNILTFSDFDAISENTQDQLIELNRYRDSISSIAYHILKIKSLYKWKTGVLDYISGNFVVFGGYKKLAPDDKLNILKRFNSSFEYPNNYGIEPRILSKSVEYIKFIYQKFNTASYLNTGKYSFDFIYKEIKQSDIDYETKEKLMSGLIYKSNRQSIDIKSIFNDAQSFIQNKSYLKLIDELRKRDSGNKFLNFKLKNTSNNEITLSEFSDKVILLDFWYTGCGHCKELYTSVLSKVEKNFKNNPDVVFISISIDKEKEKWQKSVMNGNYTSENAINLYTSGLGSKHKIINTYNISGYPTLILLDKATKIKYFNTANLYESFSLTKAIKDLL